MSMRETIYCASESTVKSSGCIYVAQMSLLDEDTNILCQQSSGNAESSENHGVYSKKCSRARALSPGIASSNERDRMATSDTSGVATSTHTEGWYGILFKAPRDGYWH